jgi:parvulin-like peptidyl-prolyl isomerase
VAAVVVAGVVAAAGCSQVNQPALSMSTSASTDPYFTITREDLLKKVDETQSKTPATVDKTSYSTKTIAAYLTDQALQEFQKQFLSQQDVVITDADTKAATQAAQQAASQQGATVDPAKVNEQARLIAVERKLTEEAFNSGKLDRQKFLTDYYEKNKASFTTPAQTCIHLIGIQAGTGTATATDADYTTAATKAAEVRRRLDTEPFETVADVSQVPNAPKGGDVGCVGADQLGPDLEKAIAPLAKGAISEPLRTQGGYFIIRVDDRKVESVVPFEQAKADVQTAVEQEVGRQLISDAALKELERTVVTVDPRFGYWSFEQRAVLPPQGAQTPTVPTSAPAPKVGQLPLGTGTDPTATDPTATSGSSRGAGSGSATASTTPVTTR